MLIEPNKNSPDDLTGEVICGSETLPGIGTVRNLPDVPCRYAMIASWTVGTDTARTAKTGASAATQGSGSAGVEMYFGFEGKLFAQLFTGERTELFRVNNLNQLCVSGSGTVYYACFR